MSRTQFLDQLLLVSAVLHDDQERELGKLGLTPRTTHVLWLVHHGGPQRQRDLADAMQVTPRHVTTLVDGLIADGLVERTPHPDDRRAVLVTLTPRGAQLMSTMADDNVRLAASLTEGWTDAEVDDLRGRIETVTARLHALIEEAAG